MYPYLRAALRLFGPSRGKPPLKITDSFETHHRAWPTDTDIFGELNHGRILTLFELARWEMTRRMGLRRLVLREGYGFAIAGASVRYRRRIPTWSRYKVATRILGWDTRFIYIQQTMWLKGEACHSVLLRTAFVRRGRAVPTAELEEKIGLGESPELPPWVRAWIEADATRPWPPEI